MSTNIKKHPSAGLIAQIKTIFTGLKIDKHIITEVSAIARQVAGKDTLEAVDIAQLRDLVLCSQRMEDGANLAADIMAEDPALWGRLIGKVQADTSLKRSLLRDLSATRAARTAGTKKIDKPDGGSDWKGVL